jgi:DNA-binding CsgD family transcriptional regulator
VTEPQRRNSKNMINRRLTVIVFTLFFSWQLAFPFEGQILYTLSGKYNINAYGLVIGAITATCFGLFLCGFFIRSAKTAKRLMIVSIAYCIAASGVFFFPPSFLWYAALFTGTFLAGCCVSAWGFFYKGCSPKNQRLKTAADGLIYSNIMMILLNMTAIHISPELGLALSMFVLAAALFIAVRLPDKLDQTEALAPENNQSVRVHVFKPLAFLCFFITVITINSGLMYQVLSPSFSHHESLVSWYWAVPYVAALLIMRNLPRSINRTFILYTAIAMIGFSFIAFMALDRSAPSYLLVNTLMLGACGVYDLFWWSILGEMMEFHKNPARILGAGISANVLGVLLGALIGNTIIRTDVSGSKATLLALGVVCITIIILPPLHKALTVILNDHAYLTKLSEFAPNEQTNMMETVTALETLTERENEIVPLLLKGMTYRAIAAALFISENTVKSHVKSIYAKAGVGTRMELANLVMSSTVFKS